MLCWAQYLLRRRTGHPVFVHDHQLAASGIPRPMLTLPYSHVHLVVIDTKLLAQSIVAGGPQRLAPMPWAGEGGIAVTGFRSR